MTQARREYETGAVRSADCETARYDLISPIGLRALAQTYAEGAEKFGYFNWEQGMPVADLLNHAITHIYNFLSGDRSEAHLAHAAWNLLGAIHSLEKWPHLNDAWLRGPGCTAPPMAKPAAQDTAVVDVDIKPVGDGVYAVDLGLPDAADQLEKLRKAILEKKGE